MSKVFFYQTHREQEIVLRKILEKSRDLDWKILVRGTKRDRIERLDDYLWKIPEDGFLPHGIAGGDHDHLQPILLAKDNESLEQREALVLIDGANASRNEVEAVNRVSVVFESRDQEVVRTARELWKTLREKGLPLEFWSEEARGWVKKAST